MVRETQRPGVTAWVGGTHVVFQVAKRGDPLLLFSRRTAPVVKGGRKPEALATTFFLQPLA